MALNPRPLRADEQIADWDPLEAHWHKMLEQAESRACRASARRNRAVVVAAPASSARAAKRSRSRRSPQAHGGSSSRASSKGSDSDGDGSGDPDSDPSAPPHSLPHSASLPLPDDRLWSVQDLAYFLGISADRVYHLLSAKRFPEAIPAPSCRILKYPKWRPQDVERWLALRCAAYEMEHGLALEDASPAPAPASVKKRGRGRPRLSDNRQAGGAK